ncbi:YaiO family outer membrane beta-barrel protein [Sphingobacterium gobiense]|uniref:YaiO beta-barrel domain-containing protein n=1 Tax=Sphingobacterium gobiense TaxID=1382456 RepID=A0A2S9JTS6_9SPHI|nr:YaiO family outer membrane beta-barrel protein [Sphingobacterium gobiense]PRD56669.1 hypothetical protein C5749_05410 [Sphingobacterium gobiense]
MKRYCYLVLISLLPLAIYGQEGQSSDDLFAKARYAAFEEKNYTSAIQLAKQALEKSPEYTDISIFLGRLYTWTEDVASARQVYEALDKKNVTDEDFFVAYGSLEYWNDHYKKAIGIIDRGITRHPQSETLWLLKAKIHSADNDYVEAEKATSSALEIDPKNTEARAIAARIRELSSKNAFGVTYSFSHFDKQFDNDWHTVGISYRRITPIGSVIARGNYANRFGENGAQFELEAYPRLSKMFYLYLGAAYSDNVGIFPKYRTGASLYANLPNSFEGELGYRQLHFSNNIWMYTASVGKYYKNLWFNFRTYLTPDHTNISHSYTGTMRYYTKGANDYFALQVGTGISPEESINALLETYNYKLKTLKFGGEYNFSINKLNLFSIAATYYNQEYRPDEKGNQFDISIGYIKAF